MWNLILEALSFLGSVHLHVHIYIYIVAIKLKLPVLNYTPAGLLSVKLSELEALK